MYNKNKKSNDGQDIPTSKTTHETNPSTDHKEKITRNNDGTTIRHGRGPCPDTKYNKYGEES